MREYDRDTRVLTISPGDIDNTRENHGYALKPWQEYRDVWRYSGLIVKEVIFADGVKDELSCYEVGYLESRVRNWPDETNIPTRT